MKNTLKSLIAGTCLGASILTIPGCVVTEYQVRATTYPVVHPVEVYTPVPCPSTMVVSPMPVYPIVHPMPMRPIRPVFVPPRIPPRYLHPPMHPVRPGFRNPTAPRRR